MTQIRLILTKSSTSVLDVVVDNSNLRARSPPGQGAFFFYESAYSPPGHLVASQLSATQQICQTMPSGMRHSWRLQ